jgi:diguanylate cyclase (GGDEF)-like protein
MGRVSVESESAYTFLASKMPKNSGGRAVVLLTFTIGLLNICLGYALAVFLGYGPPSLSEGWDAALVEPSGQGPSLAAGSAPAAAAAGGPTADAAAAPSASPPAAPAPWQLDEKLVESNILNFNVAIVRSGAQMGDIETRLRKREGTWDAETIAACLAELEKDAADYLAEQGRLAEQFHGRIAELGEMTAVGEQIETANLAAIAQLETTVSNLKHMDFQSDLQAAGERLLQEISNLRTARHQLRDDHEAAFLAVARHQDRLGQIDPQAQVDQVTGLANRVGVETTLWRWWQEGYPQKHQMGGILLEPDGFGKIARNLGSAAADRLLAALGGIVAQVSGPPHVVARFAEGRFLVVMLDTGPQGLRKMGELLRQSIERTTPINNGNPIALMASAGIAPVLPDDSVEAFLKRTEQALRAARQGGGSQACFADGKEPEPVEALDLRAEFREVAV